MDFGAGYRVYFGKVGDKLVLLLVEAPRSAKATILKQHTQHGSIIRTERRQRMITSRPFSEIVRESLQLKEVRRVFLSEAVAAMTSGDVEHGKILLREYVNGTIGFVKLGAALGKSPKSLMRMLSATGNPGVRGFFEIVAYLQKIDKTVLTVHAIAA